MIRRNLGLTREQLDDVFKYWVRRFGLEGWHITCEFYKKLPDIPGADRMQGESLPDALNSTASIKILPLEMWKFSDTPHDVEETVVHELLHVSTDFIWCRYKTDSLEQQIFHAHIDKVAWMLVDERRGGPLLEGMPDPTYLAPAAEKRTAVRKSRAAKTKQ